MNMISTSGVLFEYGLPITSTSYHGDRGGEQNVTHYFHFLKI